MKEEQKNKIEEIINLAEEKYNKDFEEINTLHFGIYAEYPNPIPIMFERGFIGLPFFESQFTTNKELYMKWLIFLSKSNYIAGENIIDITVSLSEIFNKNMTKKEAEKLLFIKNDIEKEDMGAGIPAGLGKFCVFTEEFRKIIEEYYEKDKYGIERVILAIANYFNGK